MDGGGEWLGDGDGWSRSIALGVRNEVRESLRRVIEIEIFCSSSTTSKS